MCCSLSSSFSFILTYLLSDCLSQKAGAYHAAAQEGIAIICPDTSPRGANIEGDKESWDFGEGAGFYVSVIGIYVTIANQRFASCLLFHGI